MSVKLIEKLAYILTKMSAALLIGIGLYHLVKQNLNHDSFFCFFCWLFLMGTGVIAGRDNSFIQRVLKKPEIVVFLTAFFVRAVFCIIWNIAPDNDFLATYERAGILAVTPVSGWNSALGETYTEVFPYITPYIIYEAAVIKIFGSKSIIVLQLINILSSSGSCVLLYKIGTYVWGGVGKKTGRLAAWLYIWNPTVLFFMSVLTCQHIALFFLLLGIYIVIRQPWKKWIVNWLVAGIIMAVSNLFRPEILIVNIALFCIAIIYVLREKDVKKTVKFYGTYILSYMVFLGLVNIMLMGNHIVDKSILNSNVAYKLLIGLNYEHHGTWNMEDAVMIAEDEEELWKLVRERIREPLKLGELAKEKIYITWGEYTNYSCHGNWDELSAKMYFQQNILSALCNGYMLFVIFFAFSKCVSLKKDLKTNEWFITIIMIGYCMVYILIETSNRYVYVFVPFFTLLAADGWIYLDRNTLRLKELMKRSS